MVDASRVSVIATGPHGFAGAQQAMSQALRSLAEVGCGVTYVGTEKPFVFRFTDPGGIAFRRVRIACGGAIGTDRAVASPDVLLSCQLAEGMAMAATESQGARDHLVLWGTYLLPYGLAALTGHRLLGAKGIGCQVWVTAAGSDIWELGPQLPLTVRGLVEEPAVSRVITYSERFALEVRGRLGIRRQVDWVYPGIDFARFRPLTAQQRSAARRALGLADTCFVISSHSNMRPVKCPEDVIEVAHQVARRIERRVVLLLIGPKTGLATSPTQCTSGLRTVLTGVVERPEVLVRIADAELNCSRHDSFNISLAEAMACGVPCVSTDVVGVGPEIVRSRAGLLFPYEARDRTGQGHRPRYEAAVNYLVRLAESEEMRRETGARASAHARVVFDPKNLVARLLSLVG